MTHPIGLTQKALNTSRSSHRCIQVLTCFCPSGQLQVKVRSTPGRDHSTMDVCPPSPCMTPHQGNPGPQPAAQVLPQLPGGSRVMTPPTSLALSDRPAHQHNQAASFVHTDVCLFMDHVKQLVTATHHAVTEAKTHPAIGPFWLFPA